MNCSSCGTQLPARARVCPHCGTPTPSYYSSPGPSSYDPPTVPSSSGSQSGSSAPGTPSQPSTAYGSSSYTPPPAPSGNQNPYTPPPPPNPSDVKQSTGPQPTYPPLPTSTGPQGQKQPRLSPTGITVLLIVLAVLLIAGSGLIYYTTVYRPNQLHAQATATAVAQITGTANAAVATTQAQTNATATAVAQVTAQAQATQTALQNIYTQATSGTPTINDPLKGQDSFSWDEFAGAPSGGCAFKGGSYHSSSPKGYYGLCVANATNFSNFAFQVEMTIISGPSGAIIFRCDTAHQHFYAFDINTDGSYFLYKVTIDSNSLAHSSTLISGSTSAINAGNNQSNLITVVARGNSFYLYVNKQYIDSTSDDTYMSGAIGVITFSSTTTDEAVFSNAQVWKL